MRTRLLFIVGLVMVIGAAEARAQALADAPGASRLFMGPTARMLPPGEGYIAGYGLLVPTVQVGVTKRFSMGAGTMPIGLLLSDVPFTFWVTPKVQIFDGARTDVAAGVLHSTYVGHGNVGLAYVVATMGDAKGSVTAGGGLAYARDNDSDSGGVSPIFQLGGDRRVNRRLSVVTENYFSLHGVGLLSGGVRLHGGRFSFDLGLMAPFALGEFAMVGPIMNWAWKF